MDLKKLRKEIDRVDEGLLKLLKRRKSLAEKIALVKKKQGLPIFNRQREKEIWRKLDKWSVRHGLRKTHLQKFWGELMKEAKVVQKKLTK